MTSAVLHEEMPVPAPRSSPGGAGVGLVVPLLVLMVVAFDLPLIGMLLRSLSPPEFTLDAYQEVVTAEVYVKVLLNTFGIAGTATLFCALLGYPLAYWMRGLSPGAQLAALALVIVPFWVSVLIRTYSWIILLGNAGIVNSALKSFGWIDEPISFLYNRVGVTIGIVNVLLPFLVLPLFAAMVKVDERLLNASRSLGASDSQTFWRVFLPLTMPALVAGCLLVFLMALGFYVTPMVLGGGRVPMLVNMLDLLVNRMPNWSVASAISVLLLAITLVLYAISRWLGNRTVL